MTCSVDDCSDPVKARGMCQRHYHRYWTKYLNPKRCSIEGCAGRAKCRGWCATHYSQYRRTGDPLGSLRPDPADRFFTRLSFGARFQGTHCLLFEGADNNGYGAFRHDGRTEPAHRWLYKRWTGEDIEGVQLHHRCHTKRCVNPNHLEVLTVSEHARRHQQERGEITHCPAGHEYDEANTYVHPTRGYRCCRACHRERERKRLRRLRAAN